jgi:glucose/arabinose dehydrogenase
MNIIHSLERFGRGSGAAVACVFVALLVAGLMTACSSSDGPVEPVPTPLAVSNVESNDLDRVIVTFNKAVDAASAQDPANYSVIENTTSPTSPTGPVTSSAPPPGIIDATLQSDGRRVILWTVALAAGKSYNVTVSGVKDSGGDTIASGATKTFDSEKTSGIIYTWAGSGPADQGAWDGDNNILTKSRFFLPADLTFTSTGLYMLDWNNHRVRRLTQQNTLVTVIGNFLGDGDPAEKDKIYPGVPGTTVNLNHPTDVDELPDGRILLTAWHNHKLRVFDPTTDLVYVSAGDGADFAGDGGPARDALFSQPSESEVAANGDIYVLDQRNQCVRKITAATDIITTVVGTPLVAGFEGDGGDPANCKLNLPAGANPPTSGALCFDAQGRLYISDSGNHRIRRVDFNDNKIVTIAGDGVAGFSGDGGDATAASLNHPRDLEIGPDGRLYIVDEMNHRIRAVDLISGVIVTVAGDGRAGFAGDGGSATSASLNQPWGIAFDSTGYLYIADAFNHRIRRVSP